MVSVETSDSTGRADLPSTPSRVSAGGAVGETADRRAARRSRLPRHTSIIQLLFPVVGGLGMVGFAFVYRNPRSCTSRAAMLSLMLLFSIGMRWSQKRGVRKRAAEEARRYAKYLREREGELARGGGAPARRAGAPVPGARPAVDAAGQAPERLGAPAGPSRLPARARRDRARCRSTARSSSISAMNPLAEYQAQSLQEARKLVDRRATLRGEAVVVGLAGRRRARRHRRPQPRPRVGAHADGPARRLARAARPARADRLRRRRAADDVGVGQVAAAPAGRPERPAASFLIARSAADLEALLEPELRPRAGTAAPAGRGRRRAAATCRWSRRS